MEWGWRLGGWNAGKEQTGEVWCSKSVEPRNATHGKMREKVTGKEPMAVVSNQTNRQGQDPTVTVSGLAMSPSHNQERERQTTRKEAGESGEDGEVVEGSWPAVGSTCSVMVWLRLRLHCTLCTPTSSTRRWCFRTV